MGLEAMGSGLKTRIATITDIKHVYAPNELPNAINEFPTAIILPGETTYHILFGGAQDYKFRVIILLAKTTNQTALARMLNYLDPTGSDSVYAAVDGDTTLGGAASWAVVDSNSGVGWTQWGERAYLSTEFVVSCQS